MNKYGLLYGLTICYTSYENDKWNMVRQVLQVSHEIQGMFQVIECFLKNCSAVVIDFRITECEERLVQSFFNEKGSLFH